MKIRAMKICAVLFAAAWIGVSALPLTAQAPQQQPAPGQPAPVQVGVPQGSTADQQRVQTRQQQQAAERAKLAALPIPRFPDGHLVIGATKEMKGVWLPGPANFGITAPPYQEWTRSVAQYRRRMQLEPHTRCKPSGGPRQFLTPYGVEIVELPEVKRAYIFDIGGPHTYRTVYMDTKTHPAKLEPTFYGHSVGWWEGDTLVIDTVGFNEDMWIDRGNLPHTSQLHLIERLTRSRFDSLKYEITVDDPGAYTQTFSGSVDLRWEPGTELFEYVCQQENYAHTLMVGEGTAVDRSSAFIP
jgi:hypothetical protein